MQFPSHLRTFVQTDLTGWRPKQNSQVLLIGFDHEISRILTEYLNALSFEVHYSDQPFDGLAALIEDPGAWMACIVDAKSFSSDAEFGRYQQLFVFEGRDIGMILGNAGPARVEQHNFDPVNGVDDAIGDITDPQQFLAAMSSVLARRGFAVTEPKPEPCATMAPDNRATRCRSKGPSFYPKLRRPAYNSRSAAPQFTPGNSALLHPENA